MKKIISTVIYLGLYSCIIFTSESEKSRSTNSMSSILFNDSDSDQDIDNHHKNHPYKKNKFLLQNQKQYQILLLFYKAFYKALDNPELFTSNELQKYIQPAIENPSYLDEIALAFNQVITKPLLITAVEKNSIDAVHFLIDCNVNINVKDMHGYTALHRAAHDNNLAILKLLIKNKANLELKGQHQYTALLLAAHNAHFQTIKTLSDAHADFKVCDHNKNSIFHILFNDAYILSTPFKQSVDLILENNISINTKNSFGMTVLHEMIEQEKYDFAKFAIKKGADIHVKNKQGKTALLLAFSRSKTQEQTHNLHNENFIDRLIMYGASGKDIDNHGNTVFHEIAYNLNYNAIPQAFLLQADIQSRNENGKTPLHIAVERYSPYHDDSSLTIESLLKSGADITIPDNEGKTILNYLDFKDILKQIPALKQYTILAYIQKNAPSKLPYNKWEHEQSLMIASITEEINRNNRSQVVSLPKIEPVKISHSTTTTHPKTQHHKQNVQHKKYKISHQRKHF